MATSKDITARLKLDTSQFSGTLRKSLRTLSGGTAPVLTVGNGIRSAARETKKLTGTSDDVTKAWNKNKLSIDSQVASVVLLEKGLRRNTTEADRYGRKLMTARDAVSATNVKTRQLTHRPDSPATSSPGTVAIKTVVAATAISGLSKLKTTIGSVKASVQSTTDTLTHFRSAAAAPKVDESYNVLKDKIATTGNVAADTITKITKTADATVSGIGTSTQQLADSVGKVNNAVDGTSSTLSKYRIHLMLIGQAIAFLSPRLFGMGSLLKLPGLSQASALVQFFSDRIFKASGILSAAHGVFSGFAFLITGRYKKASGVAGAFGNAVVAAVTPLRMFMVAVMGVVTVLKSVMAAFNFVTAPVRLLINAFSNARLQMHIMNKVLDLLPPKYRSIAKSILYAQSSFGPLYLIMDAVTLATRGTARGLGLLGKATIATGKAMLRPKQTATAVAARFQQLKVSASAAASALKNPRQAARMLAGGLKRLKGSAASAAATIGTGVLRTALVSAATGFRIARTAGRLFASAIRRTGKAASFATSGLRKLTGGAKRVTKSLKTGAVKAFTGSVKKLGSTAGSAFGGMTAKLAMVPLAFAGAMAASLAWGGSLAVASEQSEVAFTTILKDADQAKAVLAGIEEFSASTPFANSDLRQTGQMLLGAQIPANELIGKMKMLGDIAAGTGKPIKEFATIFAKVKNTGKASLETINQLAERNVPIYAALQQTLGVSKSKMLDMVSKGKIGFNELEAAMASTTTGSGQFAGGMEKQSRTVAGLWSTLKDNLGLMFEGVAAPIVMSFKGILSGAISMVQGIRSGIAMLQPVFLAVASTLQAYLTALWEFWGTVFTAMFGSAKSVFTTVAEVVMTALAIAQFGFENWRSVSELVFKSIALSALMTFNDFTFFFTDKLPAMLSWFGRNWKDVFLEAGNVVLTVFENIGANIRNAMTAIWDFISSGGTASLKLSFTPLMDGFVSVLQEMPDIPKRELSGLEKSLQKDVNGLKDSLSTGVNEAVVDSLTKLDNFAPEKPVEIKAIVGDQTGRIDEDSDAGKNKRTSFAVDSLNRGSTEALKAIFAGQGKDKTASKQLSEMEKIEGHLADMKNSDIGGLPVAGAV